MIWYLLAALYVLAALASSFPIVSSLQQAGSYSSLSQMDREDWLITVGCTLLWPLTWMGSAWYHAYRAYRRAETSRALRGLGATTEKEDAERG